MNYARTSKKTYASLAFRLGMIVLAAAAISYGFLVVGVVKAAAEKQSYNEEHSALSAEINMLEQRYIAMKTALTRDEGVLLSLTDIEDRTIVSEQSLGVAFVPR